MTIFKGEKYIYLLMGYLLASKEKDKRVSIGQDDGMKGGQNYYRQFSVKEYENRILLTETKTSAHFADYSKTYEVILCQSRTPIIKEYIDIENGENWSKNWYH